MEISHNSEYCVSLDTQDHLNEVYHKYEENPSPHITFQVKPNQIPYPQTFQQN